MTQPHLDPAQVCVIYNPAAAGGRTRRAWRELTDRLGKTATYLPTAGPGDGIRLAQAAARQGFATVAAAGGDGTVHEVANGLLLARSATTAFGVLPLGSGNDYAAALGVPSQPSAQVARLLSPTTWSADVGEVATPDRPPRWFVNTVGFCLSSRVTWEALLLKKAYRGLRGVPLYGWAALRAIWSHFVPVPMKITIDATPWETKTLYLAVGVGQAEGGGFVIAPQAQLDDGRLDYLHAGPISRLGAVGYLPRMLLGWLPESDSFIRRGQCQKLTLQSEVPFLIHTDGEMLAGPANPACEATITICPTALLIRGPRPTT
jgi:YegS/Rv2252/BmrU family lipid kinase